MTVISKLVDNVEYARGEHINDLRAMAELVFKYGEIKA
jgi:hypothetical protein